eukprot:s5637_g1.t1
MWCCSQTLFHFFGVGGVGNAELATDESLAKCTMHVTPRILLVGKWWKMAVELCCGLLVGARGDPRKMPGCMEVCKAILAVILSVIAWLGTFCGHKAAEANAPPEEAYERGNSGHEAEEPDETEEILLKISRPTSELEGALLL